MLRVLCKPNPFFFSLLQGKIFFRGEEALAKGKKKLELASQKKKLAG